MTEQQAVEALTQVGDIKLLVITIAMGITWLIFCDIMRP